MLGEIAAEKIESRTIATENDKLIKEIISDIIETKAELDSAVQNYNFADCDELIDHYSYRIKAAQTKYNLLLRKAKERGLTNAGYLADTIRNKR